MELLQQRERIGAEAAYIVGGHQRDGADEHWRRSEIEYVEAGAVGCCRRTKTKVELFILVAVGVERKIVHARFVRISYYDLDSFRVRSFCLKPDVAAVLFARHHGEIVLPDSALRRHERCLLAHEWRLLNHLRRTGRFVYFQHFPRRGADDWKLGAFEIAVRVVLIGDGKIEFAVFEHFGPDPAVNAAAQMLDELAVDEWTDRRAGFRGIDRDVHGVAVGCRGNGVCARYKG